MQSCRKINICHFCCTFDNKTKPKMNMYLVNCNNLTCQFGMNNIKRRESCWLNGTVSNGVFGITSWFCSSDSSFASQKRSVGSTFNYGQTHKYE